MLYFYFYTATMGLANWDVAMKNSFLHSSKASFLHKIYKKGIFLFQKKNKHTIRFFGIIVFLVIQDCTDLYLFFSLKLLLKTKINCYCDYRNKYSFILHFTYNHLSLRLSSKISDKHSFFSKTNDYIEIS